MPISDVSPVLKQALEEQMIGTPTVLHDDGTTSPPPMALFIDVNALKENFENCKKAFGDGFLHAMAIKANPVSRCIKMAVEAGIGIECASIAEVMHGLRCGCPEEHIVFDSPVKTRPEIDYALAHNVHLNIDNWQEMDVVAEAYNKVKDTTKAVIGVRVNPVVGSGSMAIFSTCTATSKFGVTILDDAVRERFIAKVSSTPCITCLHVHVGSMGCKLELMAEGVQKTVQLALDINKRAGFDQITVLDVGGGLPANVDTEETTPTFEEYVKALKDVVPEMFPGKGPFKRVITEFGQAFNCKSGWIASRVEYDKEVGDETHLPLIHAGADILMRTCYLADMPKHQKRLFVYGSNGDIKEDDVCLQDIGGPLCFSGDVVAKQRQLPRANRGDFVVLRDCGANSISIFSRHCSRLAPPVYGYVVVDGKAQLTIFKESERVDDILHFFGGTAAV
eukprot:scpid56560/ scgid3604/ Diaminopimelate decarboxylase